ncbi:hypothetical protein Tsubulata_012353 [Turnera subulata]|uniref:Serine aminopeptidase S33 domain-containing protein n=1 Tax=Turnera subulata TaxID=218843 RepID=A0A9Q0IY76_9ROSI|nr:hypothetical protein Tsubulata_012353 [Turnera subulata]
MESSLSPYAALLTALCQIPVLHYLVAFWIFSFIYLYNFLEFHFFQDLLGGGTPIGLIYHPSSELYKTVVSKCKVLNARYWATPWVSSPHLMTCFLRFLGKSPDCTYTREIFRTPEGGTLALDWLLSSNVSGAGSQGNNKISKDDTTRIVIVIPGLSSDGNSNYIKQFAFHMARSGWNVLVSNHCGMGGVQITYPRFYTAGGTEDLRTVINYIHNEYPKAPLFVVGTSIGANILVKYLGEEGEKTPIAGAAAVCNPWDLLIGDRFIDRKPKQRFYDRALAAGLKRYAAKYARRLREYDTHAACMLSNFETADAYYRMNSSASYALTISVPLLCINALDDPVCSKETIPFDECRANKNIVLATTQHGGHLAFLEGFAGGMWWVRAVNEFLDVLYSNPCKPVQKEPYVNGKENGFHLL